MTLSKGETIMCGVALAAAVFALGSAVRGCGGNPGEGTAVVHPGIVKRLGRVPNIAPTPGKKSRAVPPNPKDWFRRDVQVKKGRSPLQ